MSVWGRVLDVFHCVVHGVFDGGVMVVCFPVELYCACQRMVMESKQGEN